MQHYIRSITISLLERVSRDQLHYTPAELSESGYPDFVVDRIRLELQRNLAESVTLPDSDWADMQADPVQDAWDRFLEAINAETRIPESYLRSVTENAVEDILEQLAEPEKFVLDTLFRHDKEVSVLEMHARREWIVLNGHLADAVLRYMQRRDLKTITRDRAAGIIRQIDQHLASGYTPLKWAQALDICFKLMGSQVPSTLFARYFADKGLDDVAERMQNADEELSRSRLIELLSSPGLDWSRKDAATDSAKPAEQPQEGSTHTDTMPESTIAETFHGKKPFDNAMEDDSISGELGGTVDPDESVDEPDTPAFSQTESSTTRVKTQTGEPKSSTHSDPGADDTQSLQQNEADSPAPHGDPFRHLYEDDASAPEPTIADSLHDMDTDEDETHASDDDEIPELSQSDGDEEELPIWMRFLDADAVDEDTDLTTSPSEAFQEDGNSTESSYEEPLIQRFQHEDSDDGAQEPEESPDISPRNMLTDASKDLLDHMGTHADLFLQDFFKNELDDFYHSLNALTGFQTWQEAGTYLTREIFIPREIDIYSGEAVLFVDLLQQYFEETS